MLLLYMVSYFVAIHPCSGILTPPHLICKANESYDGYYFECKAECNDDQNTVCGSDYVTYKNKCTMFKEACLNYGHDLLPNITVRYNGTCKGIFIY